MLPKKYVSIEMLLYLLRCLLQFKILQLKSLKTVWVHFSLKKDVGNTLNGNMREPKKVTKKCK